jgi:hypothetical protein
LKQTKGSKTRQTFLLSSQASCRGGFPNRSRLDHREEIQTESDNGGKEKKTKRGRKKKKPNLYAVAPQKNQVFLFPSIPIFASPSNSFPHTHTRRKKEKCEECCNPNARSFRSHYPMLSLAQRQIASSKRTTDSSAGVDPRVLESASRANSHAGHGSKWLCIAISARRGPRPLSSWIAGR